VIGEVSVVGTGSQALQDADSAATDDELEAGGSRYHLVLDEQADQLFAMTDSIAERVRKVGGTTLRSIGHIARIQRVSDNDADYVEPEDMLAELREDSNTLAARLREAHDVCDEHRDIATASLIEVWIDETERRAWFLFEASRQGESSGH